jgi:hypothetical protein
MLEPCPLGQTAFSVRPTEGLLERYKPYLLVVITLITRWKSGLTGCDKFIQKSY